MPTQERHRLVALRRLRILDTPREETFDRITSILARILDVPCATIAFVDEARIWFKSVYGFESSESPREPGLCASAIERDGVRYLEDAQLDAESRENSLVAQEDGIRFYVAAPLRTEDGHRIGTLCAYGPTPRKMTDVELQLVEQLAALVMHEIRIRRERGPIDPRHRGTVLVVDDDPLILTLIERALERVGFRSLTATDRAEAAAVLAPLETPVDALILDIDQPSSEFVATLRALRAAAPNARLILAGGGGREDAEARFADVSHDGFLAKPFGPDDLLAAVERALHA